MKKNLISNLKKELDVLSSEEKNALEGGASSKRGFVYGDGCCRPWFGQPPINCNYPQGYSGPC